MTGPGEIKSTQHKERPAEKTDGKQQGRPLAPNTVINRAPKHAEEYDTQDDACQSCQAKIDYFTGGHADDDSLVLYVSRDVPSSPSARR